MKVNQDKYHLRISDHNLKLFWLRLGRQKFGKVEGKIFLGVVTANDLNFDKFVITLCKKAEKKLSALARRSTFFKFG